MSCYNSRRIRVVKKEIKKAHWVVLFYLFIAAGFGYYLYHIIIYLIKDFYK